SRRIEHGSTGAEKRPVEAGKRFDIGGNVNRRAPRAAVPNLGVHIQMKRNERSHPIHHNEPGSRWRNVSRDRIVRDKQSLAPKRDAPRAGYKVELLQISAGQWTCRGK